jgi:MFS family permease
MPWWFLTLLVAAALGSGHVFVVRQLRHPNPLVDLRLLASERTGVGLLGALSGYLVLFGPLVLVPVALDRLGVPVETAGAVLTALPAGFALAATLADRVLPGSWGDRRRARLGAVTTVSALILLLVLPVSAAALPWPLLLLGLGLGVFTPANNTLVMRAIPATSAGTAGGLVNMARGLGTALGVAAVTLTLHLAGHGPGAARVAAAVLLAASVGTVASALPGRRTRAGGRG